MVKLSLALTTYNRYQSTVQAISQVLNDPRITDIVILDDCSTDGSYELLGEYYAGTLKVRVLQQPKNVGMSLNKRDAIYYANNDWVIIFDSDNIIGPEYIDAFYKRAAALSHSSKTIYCPDFAKPNFNYHAFASYYVSVSLDNHSSVIQTSMGNCLFNTCNYVVNRHQYLACYSHNPAHYASDTIWFNYLWLKAGNSFFVVPGMEYEHKVHADSGFMKHVEYNMQ